MDALFIFHRSIGSNDEDATVQERCEKILHYQSHENKSDPEHQMAEVNICEALIEMCKTFGSTESCETIVTSTMCYSLYECEEDIWMVLSVPTASQRSKILSKPSGFKIPLIRSSKTGDVVVSGHEGCPLGRGKPNANVMRSILREIYSAYRLLNGTISSLLIVDMVPWKIKELRRGK